MNPCNEFFLPTIQFFGLVAVRFQIGKYSCYLSDNESRYAISLAC